MKSSRGQIILLLKTRWSHRIGLCFLIPPIVLCVAVGLLAQCMVPGSPSAVLIGNCFKYATVMVTALEVLAFICTLTWYFLNEVFIDEFERADKLISRLEPTERASTFSLMAGLHAEEQKDHVDSLVESLVAQLLRAETLGAEAFDRIIMFVFLAMRLLFVFSLATVALEFANFLTGNSKSVFGKISYSFNSVAGILSVVEQAIYGNLTTIATVGFGDMAPEMLAGRLLVNMEIATAILFLSFGINMLATLVMDSSVLAWSGRREVVELHIRRSIEQIRNVEGTTT